MWKSKDDGIKGFIGLRKGLASIKVQSFDLLAT